MSSKTFNDEVAKYYVLSRVSLEDLLFKMVGAAAQRQYTNLNSEQLENALSSEPIGSKRAVLQALANQKRDEENWDPAEHNGKTYAQWQDESVGRNDNLPQKTYDTATQSYFVLSRQQLLDKLVQTIGQTSTDQYDKLSLDQLNSNLSNLPLTDTRALLYALYLQKVDEENWDPAKHHGLSYAQWQDRKDLPDSTPSGSDTSKPTSYPPENPPAVSSPSQPSSSSPILQGVPDVFSNWDRPQWVDEENHYTQFKYRGDEVYRNAGNDLDLLNTNLYG